MDKEYFLIVGMPRCRTAWFSNLLTTGESVCYHELVPAITLDELVRVMRDATHRVVGYSSPNPSVYWRLKKEFPGIRVVVVIRPLEGIKESLLGLFPTVNLETLDEYVENTHLECLDVYLDSGCELVDVENLDTHVVMMVVGEVVPTLKLDMTRVRMLEVLNVQADCRRYGSISDFMDRQKQLLKES